MFYRKALMSVFSKCAIALIELTSKTLAFTSGMHFMFTALGFKSNSIEQPLVTSYSLTLQIDISFYRLRTTVTTWKTENATKYFHLLTSFLAAFFANGMVLRNQVLALQEP